MKNPFAKKVVVLFLFAVLAVGIAAANHSGDGTPPLEVAYAHVFGDGTLDRANSRGVIRMAGGSGLYCFKLAFQPREVAVTLADDPTAANQGVGFIKAALPPTPLFTCDTIPNPDAVVETGSQTGVNSGVSDGGYAFYADWRR